MEHTKLPWKVDKNKMGDIYIIGQNKLENIDICQMNNQFNVVEANAEFIIRACNSHYGLLEAYKLAAKYLF